MKLRRLAITHLPGISAAFRLDGLADGVTVVTGPNASGKSSLVRALRHLIDADASPADGALTLEAEFESPAGRWTVRRAGSQVEWLQHGRRVEPPVLPRGDFLRCYWLTMRELLEAGATEQRIAASLRQSLYGGYDLDAVRRQLARSPTGDVEVGPRHGRRESSDFQACLRALRGIENEYAQLERERSHLPVLGEDIEQARADQARLLVIDHARKWLEASREVERARTRLAQFPDGMERLSGRELQDLESLHKRRDKAQGELRETTLRLEAASREAADTGLGEAAFELVELRARAQSLRDARVTVNEIGRLEGELIEARARRRQLENRLRAPFDAADRSMPGSDAGVPADVAGAGDTGGEPVDRSIRLDADAVDQAVKLAEKIRNARRRLAEFSPHATSTADDDAVNRLSAYQALVAELRRWLRLPQPSRLRGVRIGAWIALLAGVLGALGALTGIAAAPGSVTLSLWILLCAVLAAAAGGGVVAWHARMPRAERAAVEQRLHEYARELNLSLPEPMDGDAVGAWLGELEQQQTVIHVQTAQADYVRRQADQASRVRDDLRQLELQHRELMQSLGFSAAATAEGTARFLQLTLDHDQAVALCASLTDRIAAARAAVTEVIAAVHDVLARTFPHGDTALSVSPGGEDTCVPTQAEALRWCQSRLDDLLERADRLAAARRDRQDAEQQLARVRSEIDGIDRDTAILFEQAGLPGASEHELRMRCERVAEYREAQRALDDALTVERERREHVNADADADADAELLACVEQGNEDGLITMRNQLAQSGSRLNGLVDRSAEIRERIRLAGGDRRLETARRAVDEARDALQEAFEQAMFAEAGAFLIDDVAGEHRSEQEPAVLAAARARFAAFTNHRYDLEIDANGHPRARDREQDTLHELATLSTGTCMQLLIAVRLAWTQVAEQGGQSLPLFLDEALTTTDPERFDSIVTSLERMADEEGRQVFYLSAQPADVHRWERAAGRAPAHVDLPYIRFGESSLTTDDHQLSIAQPIPPPDDLSPEEYAVRLGVPPLRPREGAGALPIFHLLRDRLDLLHRLMNEWRVAHAGPFWQLLRSDAGAKAVPDEQWRARLLDRYRIAQTWCELWRRGRGLPVERNALEQSGAVSDRFMDEVSALAQRCDGDAGSLLQRLQARAVSGFHRSKLEELAEWLTDHGYLVPEEQLSRQERLSQSLRLCGGYATPAEIHAVVASLEAGVAAGGG